MVHETLGWEISRLRVSWARFPSAPYRHATPLEMTVVASALRHFDRSGAEWRNLTPHGTGGMAAGVLSAQSLMSPRGSSHTGISSARDDQWTCILLSENRYGNKGCEEMICMSSRSFFVGEIPWGCEVMAYHESFLPIPSHSCLWGMYSCKNKVLDRKKAFSYNKNKG